MARLECIEPDDADFSTVLRHYAPRSSAECAATWVSITPVILPGYDDNKPVKRERLLMDCLRHAGIDPSAVISIESRRAAWRPRGAGMPMSPHSAYVRPNYLRGLPACHVRVTFKALQAGPLSLGAGRHIGLGVCAVE